MSATATGYRHIKLRGGVPVITGTGYRVIPLLEQYKARGWTAEEFHQNYPEVTQAQVHSVLAYYYDHASEIDAEIQRRREVAEAVLQHLPSPPAVERLRALRASRAL